MKEMNLKKSFELSLTQFECLACKKKIYVNIEDVDSNELDCPFCNVHGIENIRLFEVVVNKIFEK